jgi:hypothetical protein
MEPIKQLRVMVRDNGDGTLEGQMIDLDIAARATSEDELVREFEYAILMEYRIAREFGRTPFLNLITSELPVFAASWRDEDASEMGRVNLPPEVMDALAMVLHTPISQFEFCETKMAA